MKRLTFIIALMSFSTLLFGQILNGSFEDWESNGIYDEPEFWNSYLFHNALPFEQDTISVDGNYSLKLLSVAGFTFECWTPIKSKGHFFTPFNQPQSLFFYIKSKSLNDIGNTYFKLTMVTFRHKVNPKYYSWQTDEVFPDFTLIEIPLENFDFDEVKITFKGAAISGPLDGCHNISEIWIDNIEIKPQSSIVSMAENIYTYPINLFPNPSSGVIYLENLNGSFDNYVILDQFGKIVQSGKTEGGKIQFSSPGFYFLQLESSIQNVKPLIRKFIVQ